jgi:hypothetical protein
MAGVDQQDSDGKWQGASGAKYDTRHGALADIARSRGGNIAMMAMGGSFASLAGAALLIGLVGSIVLFIISALFTLFVTSLEVAKLLWLFPVVLAIAIVISLFLRIKLKWKKLSFLAFVLICGIGFWLVGTYYSNSSRYFPSMFSADFIQVLPDGSLPRLYQKRHQKGTVIAELPANQKVTINGITLNSKEYNITTAEGKTGWIVRDALPEDTAEMLGIISLEFGGARSESELAFDRQVRLFMEKYMNGNIISKETLNRSVSINVQTPFMQVTAGQLKEGCGLTNSGAAVTLSNIVYAEDCTILRLTASGNALVSLFGSSNNNAWKTGFVVTDLSTGEKWNMLQSDLFKLFNYDSAGENSFNSELVMFFPPFKSRNFSLTNSNEPFPKKQKGFDLLGSISEVLNFFLAGLTKREFTYVNYSFPEVRVR